MGKCPSSSYSSMQGTICVDKHWSFALPWVNVVIHFCHHEPHKTEEWLFHSGIKSGDIAVCDQHCTHTIVLDRLNTVTWLKRHNVSTSYLAYQTLPSFPQKAFWNLVTLLTDCEQICLMYLSTESGLWPPLMLLFLYQISAIIRLCLYHVIAHSSYVFLLCLTA